MIITSGIESLVEFHFHHASLNCKHTSGQTIHFLIRFIPTKANFYNLKICHVRNNREQMTSPSSDCLDNFAERVNIVKV